MAPGQTVPLFVSRLGLDYAGAETHAATGAGVRALTGDRSSTMRLTDMISGLAVAGFLALAACANPSDSGTATTQDAACVKTCDGAMDACSIDCENLVDNLLCGQECIDKLQSCKNSCN